MSVVAWRHFPASRRPQQSDWHHCANLTKERPATKERPWGSFSLALYSSYRRMMEWQHFSLPLWLYLSCTPPPAYLCDQNCQTDQEWIKKRTNHRKIQTFFLIVCVKQCWRCAVSAAYRNREWALRRQKLASTFLRCCWMKTQRIISLHHGACVFSQRMKRIEDRRSAAEQPRPVMPIYCRSALPGAKLLMCFNQCTLHLISHIELHSSRRLRGLRNRPEKRKSSVWIPGPDGKCKARKSKSFICYQRDEWK